MTPTTPPYPRRDPVVTEDRTMSRPYQGWFDEALIPRLNRMPTVAGWKHDTNGVAGYGATPIEGYAFFGGVYRVSFALRVVQAATTSSSVMVTIAWTEGGVARSFSSPALAANTTAQYSALSVIVSADPSTPITVAVSYASVGGTPMRYALDVYAERMPQ
ncbi:MAG: hypothetical protein H0W42_02965 [Gemmatimonadaceae bacterium]|nr:hypothetical protein [Gemmatimonadaceae bacterium]